MKALCKTAAVMAILFLSSATQVVVAQKLDKGKLNERNNLYKIQSQDLGQQRKEKCGTMEYLNYLVANDPALLARIQEYEEKAEKNREYYKNHPNELIQGAKIIIPVVVHIVWNIAEENVSDYCVHEQIRILNRDYAGLNPGSMGSHNPALKINTNIQFRLATIDTLGNCTNGIERRHTDTTEYSTSYNNTTHVYRDGMKSPASMGLAAWTPSQYFNIWVCDIERFIGYAKFPSTGIDWRYGVVVDYTAFGVTGAHNPSNGGGTLSHEIGHCFDLHHVWGDGNNFLGNQYVDSDLCGDTPPVLRATYGYHWGLRTDPNSEFSPGIMYMNFMDYPDDLCYSNFTPNQSSRMTQAFNNITQLQNLKNSTSCGSIIFVKSTATGANNGISWADAYVDLQSAINAAVAGGGSQIWVAAGTYAPTGNGAGAYRHFAMKNCVYLYGGFAGNENPFTFNIYKRNFEANETILDGEGTRYHVIRNDNLDTTAVLDGFTITGGNAWTGDPSDCATTVDCEGGGMLNIHSSPKIRNCLFRNNFAGKLGGAMDNLNSSSPRITNCVFRENISSMGGGIGNYEGHPLIYNSTFVNNTAGVSGGAIFNVSVITIHNSILWDNILSQSCNTEQQLWCGYEIYNSQDATVEINNSCYPAGNFHLYNDQGTVTPVACINANPQFINATANLRLQITSPAINTGNQTVLIPEIQTDRDGNPRVIGTNVDMGAYEDVVVTCPPAQTVLGDVPYFYLTGLTPVAGNAFPPGGVFTTPAVGAITGDLFNPKQAGVGVHNITYQYTNPTTGITENCNFNISVNNPTMGQWDYGDAPDPGYPTLIASNGAAHGWQWPHLFLGNNVDFEANGQPNATASGDDNDANGDDETSVVFPPLVSGSVLSLNIAEIQSRLIRNFNNTADSEVVDAGSYICNAWIDFNQDLDWLDVGEQVIINCIPSWYNNVIDINIPATAAPGNTFARLRLSYWPSEADNWIRGGEVEDFLVTIAPPPPVIICRSDTTACSGDAAFVLTGSSPPGGTYSGIGVVNGTFNPELAGVGVFEITYIAGNQPDTDTCTFQITVIASPDVTCPATASLCQNDPPLSLTGGTPAGGTYSGPGVVNNIFYPDQTGPGSVGITYTYDEVQTGCAGDCEFIITVFPIPAVSCPADQRYCQYEPSFVLTGGFPDGGVYSEAGAPVTSFDPGTAGPGDHTLTYSYTNVNGCSGSCTFVITVDLPPDVICPGNIYLCTNDPPWVPWGATPEGGTYLMNWAPIAEFDPAASGPGTYNLVYIYSDPLTTCADTCGFLIIVSDPPVAVCPANDTVCLNDPAFPLTGASPPGGVYLQNFNVLTIFDPQTQGVGNHSIWYSYFDPNTGCSDICGFLIVVYALPVVSCPANMVVSINSPVFTLTGASPPGGTYNGTGVTGNQFNPSDAGVGQHVITYTYFNPVSACSNSCTFFITCIEQSDFGDAPDPSYPTLLASNGARHTIVEGVYLGNLIDVETNGQPTTNASGDDNASLDDEDGIIKNWGEITGSPVNIKVTASVAGYLDAWMDFNNNGSWTDAGEQIFNSQPLVVGDNILNFIVPASTINMNNFVRYRFSTQGGLPFTGQALGGEVEDYKYLFSIPSASKWLQPPNTSLGGISAHDSPGSDSLVADDWLCFGGQVTNIHWFGSYLVSGTTELRGSGIDHFHLEIFSSDLQNCVPSAGSLYSAIIPFEDLNETFTGLYTNGSASIYEYSYLLPDPYDQVQGTRYWLKLAAHSYNEADPAYWRWQEAARSQLPVLCASARNIIINGIPGSWTPVLWPAAGTSSDMAFSIGGVLVPSLINGYVKYDNPALYPPMTNTKVMLKQQGNALDSTLTSTSGYYLLDEIAPGNYKLDGKTTKPWGGVNATDALKCLKFFVGMDPCPPPDGDTLVCKACDVNGNGTVNSIDALMISRRYVGLISSFPAGDWIFQKPAVTVTQGSTSQVNFLGLCYGDANRSYNPPSAKLPPGVAIVEKDVELWYRDGMLELPLKTTGQMVAGAVSLTISYPDYWEIKEVENSHQTEGGFIWKAEDGLLKISWFSLVPMYLNPGEALFVMIISIPDLLVKGSPVEALSGSAISDEKGEEYSQVILSIPTLINGETDFWLGNNMPNPFTGITEIKFHLPENARVTLKVVNIIGETVSVLLQDKTLLSGDHQVVFDCSGCAAGVYHYSIEAVTAKEVFVQSNKMMLLR